MKNHFDRRTKWPHLVAGVVVVLLLVAGSANAQLRIISYNTSTGHNNAGGTGVKTPRAGMDIILESIGEELRNGIAKPIDVLLLQEQSSMSLTGQAFVELLNGIYGPGTYARSFVNGATSEPNGDAGRPGLVYNTNTVSLVEEVSFGTVNGTNQARSTMRYALQPVGYDETAIFYAYNSHYKAGNTASDQTRRNIEATSIRTNEFYGSDELGEGAHAIFAGDYNMPSSSQTAFQTLIAAGPGPGQANDPINRLGSWTSNILFADIHTQAPCNSGCASDMTGGGMDDRFDLQLVTGEFLDDEGLSIIGGSYHAFGNNGTTYNTDINNASNTYVFTGVSSYTKPQILNALKSVSDHIPVVADYQLPAILEAIAGTVPMTLDVGEVFNLDVMVGNDAPVDFANGADELDYSLTTSGDLSGSFLNQMDAALGALNTHFVSLNTSTPGLKSGTITITSASQGVQNGLINIPISFEVLAPVGVEGDYNDDGIVDAADYVTWRKNEGTMNVLPNDPHGGTIDGDQYDTWQANFGAMAPGGGSLGAVPEPGTGLLLVVGVFTVAGTLRRAVRHC